MGKRPFIRIGDKLHALRLDDFISQVWRSRAHLYFDMRDQHPLAGQLLIQPGGHQQVIILPVNLVDLPVKLAFDFK